MERTSSCRSNAAWKSGIVVDVVVVVVSRGFSEMAVITVRGQDVETHPVADTHGDNKR